MGKGEGFSFGLTRKRVIILVAFFTALRGHTGMAHHDVYAMRDMQVHFVRCKRSLVDSHASSNVVGDAGSVCAADLALPGKRVQDAVFLPGGKPLVVVDHSK